MLMYETSSKWVGASDDEQRTIDRFHAWLHDPDQILTYGYGPLLEAGIDGTEIVRIAKGQYVDDLFSNVKRTFAKNIWMRGLFAAIDDHTYATLGHEDNGYAIRTRMSAARVLITLSCKVSNDHCQITFIAEEDNPVNFDIQSSRGTIVQLADLVNTISEWFKPPNAAYDLMQRLP